jgi:hypothetical protein
MRGILSEEMRKRAVQTTDTEAARLLMAGALAIEEQQRGLDEAITVCKRVRNQEVSVDRKDGER